MKKIIKDIAIQWWAGIKILSEIALLAVIAILLLTFPAIFSEVFKSNWFFCLYAIHILIFLPWLAGIEHKKIG
jgi:hypothetical protein